MPMHLIHLLCSESFHLCVFPGNVVLMEVGMGVFDVVESLGSYS